MQLEELVLRIPGDEFRIRFHERLTVLSGIGVLERQALADSIVGALTGRAESTTLTYRDGTGRRVRAVSTGGRLTAAYEDDGSPAPELLGAVAADPEALRSLMLLQAADLGITPGGLRGNDPPELAEARAMLRELADQLEATVVAAREGEPLSDELAEVEYRLRAAEDGGARREYAQVLSELERVRAEAAALQGGTAGVESDRQLLAAAPDTKALAERWAAAAVHLAELTARFGDRDRLDRDDVAAAAAIPERMPTELPGLVADLDAAVAERNALSLKLKDLAASRLPEPSDPTVAQLARAEQGRLWDAHRRAVDMANRLQEAQVAMGGLGPASGNPLVAEIEAAHQRLDEAERDVEHGWRTGVLATGLGAAAALVAVELVPELAAILLALAAAAGLWFLLLPRRRMARAAVAEKAVLARADMPSYLAYQMRRVEASVDPDARQRLDLATLDHRTAVAAWHDVAGAVTVEVASRLAEEVRSYARALGSLGGAAEEIEQVRRELTERAEPAVDAARAAVLRAVAPFAVEDATEAVEAVHERVAFGRAARLQAELDRAEAAEHALGADLDHRLDELGVAEADLRERVAGLEWAVQRAEEREAVRAQGRSRDAIEDDLIRLQNEARRLRRPEWASVTSSEADAPDQAGLEARRKELLAELERVRRLEQDAEHLADRHAALERRVAALESQPGDDGAAFAEQLADVQHELLAHLTNANHPVSDHEPVPVLLDEPFLRIPVERKWELLDMLLRLSERVQLVYLTDDPYVAAWGRRRATDGAILLLEPEPEPV